MSALARPASGDTSARPGARRIARYELHGKIASGGMATVHLGCVVGAAGFSRPVAIKRLHPHMADEPEFVAMFLDEANLAARVRHPNVVSTLDVVQEGDELFLVMDYVDGASLAELTRSLSARGERAPLPVVSGIISGLLRGLHAAHEAHGPDGKPLNIVHRDVSPQNVLIGADGVARVVDFGIALANVRRQTTQHGQVKGKLAYTAPELLAARRRATVVSDVYAAGLVLWEICAGRRAFQAETEEQLLVRVVSAQLPRLDEIAPWLPLELIETIERAVARKPEDRFGTALEMAVAVEQAVTPASAQEISAFVEAIAGVKLAERRAMQRALEAAAGSVSEASNTASGVAPVRALAKSPVPTDAPDVAAVVDPMPPRLPSRRSAIVASLAVIALASAAFGFRSLSRQTPPHVADGVAPTPMTTHEPASERAPPSPDNASTAGVVPPSASPSASTAKEAARVTRPTRSPTRATVKTEKLERPAANPCDPPYTFDDQGIRRVKRECFGR